MGSAGRAGCLSGRPAPQADLQFRKASRTGCMWALLPISCYVVGEVRKLVGHAFISYARGDADHVDRLQQTLKAAGIPVWRDTADLWPGQDWRAEIRRAITDNVLVFIACFSHKSLAREKSYQRAELALAIEQLLLRPPDVPWLIPVRFDDCEIPDIDIGGGRSLGSIQRADLFGDRSDHGAARLVESVLQILERPRREQMGAAVDELAGALPIHPSGQSATISAPAATEDLEEWVDALARRLGRERAGKGSPSLHQLARNIDNKVSTATLSDAFAGRRLPSFTTLNALLDAMDSSSETRGEIRALWQEANDQLNGTADRQIYCQEFDLAMMDPTLVARQFSEMIEMDRWLGVIRKLVRMSPGPATVVLEEMDPNIVTRLLAEMSPQQAAPLLVADPEYGAARLTEMDIRQARARLLAIGTAWEAGAVLQYIEPNRAADILIQSRAPEWAVEVLAASYDHEWINKVLAAMDSETAANLSAGIKRSNRALLPRLP